MWGLSLHDALPIWHGSNSRRADDGVGDLRLKEARQDSGFVLLEAHGLLDRLVADYRDGVDALSGNAADVEGELERHVVVRMDARRGFYLEADVEILDSWIGCAD